MKKTQVIELFNNIKKSFISFISITVFVLLGISIFLGLNWTGKGFKKELNVCFDNGKAHDLEVFLPYGFTDDDLEKLKQENLIDEIEAYFCGYENFNLNNEKYFARIVSLTSDVDVVFDIEGRLPISDNEVLVEKGAANALNIKIGDEITFYGDEANYTFLINSIKESLDLSSIDYDNLNNNYLKNSCLKVVGIGESPEYISISNTSYGQSTFTGQQVNCVFFVNYDAFRKDVVKQYNYLVIRDDDLRNLDTFSDKYINGASKLSDKLNDALSDLSLNSYLKVRNNYDELNNEYNQELNDAKNSIETAKSTIETNEKKLQNAKIELDNGKTLLTEAELTINENTSTLNNYERQYQDNLNKYEKTKNAIEDYEALYKKIKDKGIANYSNEEFVQDFNLDNIKEFYEIFENNNLETNETVAFEQLQDDFYNETLVFVSDYLYILSSLSDNLTSFENGVINYAKDIVKDETLTPKEKLKTILYTGSFEGSNLYQELSNIYTNNKEIIALDTKNLFVEYTYKLFEEKLIKTNYNKLLQDYASQLEEARNELDNGWHKLYLGINEYNSSKQEYEDNLALYNSGLIKLNNAKNDLSLYVEEYDNSLVKYEEFKTYNDFIKDYGTIVLTRESNTATMYDRMLSDIIVKIKTSLGGLFLIIGILVCYSVVTRMVHDQIKQIGTKKALGLMSREITISYLAYSAISVTLGSIIGLLIAILVIEPILSPTISGTFTFDLIGDYFDLKDFLYLFIFEFAAIELITFISCYHLLNKPAFILLKGEDQSNNDKHLFKKFKWYQNLSILTQTIINNFFNDTRRVIATIIGVAGCTALIVCSLSIRNNVLDSFNSQFNDYFKFDSMIYLDLNVENSEEIVKEFLNENNITCSSIYRQFGYTSNEDDFDSLFTYLMVYDENDDNFTKLINFKSKNNKEFKMGDVMLSESIKEYAKLKDNELVEYKSLSGDDISININGFYHHYHYAPMLFIPSETYKEIFNSELTANVIIADLNNADEALINKLNSLEAVNNIFNYREYVWADVSVFLLVANVIVGIYTIAAIMMAIFVLLNLLITFVLEKKNELIVLMINGFSLKSARRYIYSDTIFLTIVGILLGTLIGIYAGDSALKAFESIYIYLNHKISIKACLIGIVTTTFLSFIMSIIALNKIKYFKLTDINKD